ncbi:MAG: SDR family NAD(P)-dependent oxidoreductase [Deltaproteobacteria bacterium]|nr:SDR family NAD(P)-dependent oxidoreductase [Deltaproteobacteria bacterium]
MIGITSYGGYIPRFRLDRMSIVQNMGWFAPAIIMVAQGERSFCNWDEDGLSMAVAASRDCLSGKDRTSVDGVFLASTTLPFADRLNAGILKTALNLKDEVSAADFTSTLRAGTTALLEAMSAVRSGDKSHVLVSASDMRQTKTAYFYEMWFGDGAASLLVGEGDDVIAEFVGGHTETVDFVDHYRGATHAFDYVWEERWVRDEGYSKIIPRTVEGLCKKLSLSMSDVDRLVFPCFFKAEHAKIARSLGVPPEKVVDNLHEVCGDTGAAHPLIMLIRALEEARPGERILVAGFGQGCDALLFETTGAIEALPKRSGIKGSLARKQTTDNYTRFLKFRGLIQTEMGIRAEAPTQTAMTVTWRNRDMLLGLVGGKCKECGTPQFPKMDLCVNPHCRRPHTQEPYGFADVIARVKSFTGDLLAVSINPPAIYGMIEFEGGGRFMADFTDCEHSDIHVGQKVSMSFRKRYSDRERGFTGYFWKAVPVPGEKPAPGERKGIRFDGRVAVVTGAGSGLGRVYALEMAGRGAKVVVNDLGGARDGTGAGSAAADKVVEEIEALGGEAVAIYDSVATPEGGQAIVDAALKTFGRVDVVINNAGILRDKTLVNTEPENWKAVVDVHLQGAYNVTRPAFINMRENGYGRIIFTSSAAGLYGNFGQSNYSAAKMGLIGFMNTLKLEGDKYNVKVNTVAPVAATRLSEDVFPPDIFRKAKPEFLAPLVLYLCSDRCKDTGMIFNAGMGYANRAAFVTGRGVALGDGVRVPTIEEIHQHWDQINDLSGAAEYPNLTAAFAPMLEALSGPQDKKEPSPAQQEITVKDVFQRMPAAFRAEMAGGVDVVFQYRIGGPEGGNWRVGVKDGHCVVTEGLHERPTTTIKMADKDFLLLISGRLNAMSAFTSGKLKIEGDIMKSQLIEKLFKF